MNARLHKCYSAARGWWDAQGLLATPGSLPWNLLDAAHRLFPYKIRCLTCFRMLPCSDLHRVSVIGARYAFCIHYNTLKATGGCRGIPMCSYAITLKYVQYTSGNLRMLVTGSIRPAKSRIRRLTCRRIPICKAFRGAFKELARTCAYMRYTRGSMTRRWNPQDIAQRLIYCKIQCLTCLRVPVCKCLSLRATLPTAFIIYIYICIYIHMKFFFAHITFQDGLGFHVSSLLHMMCRFLG